VKKLIVNADDFGLTDKTNQAILEAHQTGIITSTSLLANGAAFGSAVELAPRMPGLGVGVHLNLVEGTPVSDPSIVSSLVDNKGFFPGSPVRLARKIITGRVKLTEIERELRAQIERILTARISPTHLDGHKHFHILPSVLNIIIRLAREYEVMAVRCPAERSAHLFHLMLTNRVSSPEILKQYVAGRVLLVLASGVRKKLWRARLSCPTHFYGITQTGFLDAKCLQNIICHLPQGTSEIMCHPGYVDLDLVRTPTRLLAQREEELHALTRPEIKALVTELGIELISYRSLVDAIRKESRP
jgi:hopanoid biosynthesis associated protein HpnK